MNIWKLLKCENFVNMQTTMHVLSVRSRVSIGQSTSTSKFQIYAFLEQTGCDNL